MSVVVRLIRSVVVVFVVSLPFVACKSERHGSCMFADEGRDKESCWVWHEEKNCAYAHGTFVPQDSRDKSEMYCALEGYKGPKGATEPSVMYRPRAKAN